MSGKSWRSLTAIAILLASAVPKGDAQSDRRVTLALGGTWQLHSRLPLGSDTLLLQPAHRLITMFVTAEAPEFEGWKLTEQNEQTVLLDTAGKPVRTLPHSIVFRITATTRSNLAEANPATLESSETPDNFLLDLHFAVQIFRGMEMREVRPTRSWMIGIPAEEPSDERIYRTSFDFEDLRPDDRIALLVTDGTGKRLSKFHLEFL